MDYTVSGFSSDHCEPTWNLISRDMTFKEIGAIGRQSGVESHSPLDLTVSTDEYMNSNQDIGDVYCILFAEILEVYDAEFIGAIKVPRVLRSHMIACFATNLTACRNNKEAAIRPHSGHPTSCTYNVLVIKLGNFKRFATYGNKGIEYPELKWVHY
ncbi:hypothetical protein EPUL_005739 [Erysiphe pulchra]|uniref:Uncharacterized protein n=1 Tax=Erysiphe pulchra TaxID=225359 RepID=A0A2S4PRV7_9PEZI|nr:hypothetical protein EPUL_005739 [Erysiphe pulchra]